MPPVAAPPRAELQRLLGVRHMHPLQAITLQQVADHPRAGGAVFREKYTPAQGELMLHQRSNVRRHRGITLRPCQNSPSPPMSGRGSTAVIQSKRPLAQALSPSPAEAQGDIRAPDFRAQAASDQRARNSGSIHHQKMRRVSHGDSCQEFRPARYSSNAAPRIATHPAGPVRRLRR